MPELRTNTPVDPKGAFFHNQPARGNRQTMEPLQMCPEEIEIYERMGYKVGYDGWVSASSKATGRQHEDAQMTAEMRKQGNITGEQIARDQTIPNPLPAAGGGNLHL